MLTIEEALVYEFIDNNLLERALTRKAYASEQKQKNITCEDQEVFRILGDAVLKAILVDYLIQIGCTTREDITNKKIRLEAEPSLAAASKKLGIGTHIRLGIGEKKQRASEIPKVLAETLESIVGAIYTDGGYGKTMDVVKGWLASGIFY